MKKLFSIILTLVFILPLAAETLYIDASEIAKEFPDSKLSNVLPLVSESAKSAGIKLVDYNSLNLVPYYYNWGEYTRGKLESEKLEEKKNEIEKTLQKYGNYLSDYMDEYYLEYFLDDSVETSGRDFRSINEYIQYLDEKIAAAKEKEKNLIDPNTCYPRLILKLKKDEFYDNEIYELKIGLYINDEDYYGSRAEINPAYHKDATRRTHLIAKSIEASFPLIKGKSQKLSSPEIIDQRTMTELGTTRSGAAISVAPRSDYSFVMRSRDSIIDYSATWDVKEDLTKKINGSSKYTTWWEPYSPDGKSVLFANQSSPSVIYINEKNSLTGKVQYKFPSASSTLRFSQSGEPYLVDFINRVIYFPQRDGGQIRNMPFTLDRPVGIFCGSDDLMWFQTESMLFGYNTKDKSLKKIVFLKSDSDAKYGILKVLSDNSFLAMEDKGSSIARFSSDGLLLWTMPISDSLKYSVCCGAGYGMYFFYDAISNIFWRLAESDAKLPATLVLMKKNSKNLENATLTEMAEIYHANADVLYEAGSYASALEYYTKYLEISPADPDATEKKLMAEVAINKKTAAEKSEEALNLYDEYGEETARPVYQEAMKLLEKLRKQVPWDEEVQEAYADLKNTFSPEDGFSQAAIPSVSVTDFDLAALFPVLMNVYATNPAGFIKIKNNGSTAIKNLSVSAYVRKYMDFPSKGNTVSSLAPGAEATLEISTILNKKVLQVAENTVLQMQFTIAWEENGVSKNFSLTRPVTLYKKSAMTWDDTAMLSCFVQPNDPTVAAFAFNALSKKEGELISTNFTKAIALSNAIGAIPLTYVADPVTPISQIIDITYSVDTVRFPAETLSLKGGDCDDMTTLFCSLLESAGIPTALITTPGHIFAAFDTGLKENSAWKNLNEPYCTISIDGHVWIPIETTILYEGFETAWKYASKEISENEYEYTPLHDAWKIYSSAANPDDQKNIAFSSDTLGKLNKKSLAEVKNQLALALKKISSGSPTELNAVAKLWYSIGEKQTAVKILSTITEKAPNYRQAYSNLAAVYLELGMEDEATEVRARAKRIVGTETASTINVEATSRASDSSSFDWKD